MATFSSFRVRFKIVFFGIPHPPNPPHPHTHTKKKDSGRVAKWWRHILGSLPVPDERLWLFMLKVLLLWYVVRKKKRASRTVWSRQKIKKTAWKEDWKFTFKRGGRSLYSYNLINLIPHRWTAIRVICPLCLFVFFFFVLEDCYWFANALHDPNKAKCLQIIPLWTERPFWKTGW